MDYELHPHEVKILKALTAESLPEEVAEKAQIPLDAVMRASSWLATKNLVKISESIIEEVTLEPEGALYAEKGLPERRLVDAAKGNPSIAEIRKKLAGPEVNFALGWINRKGMAKLEGDKIVVLDDSEKPDEKLLKLLKEKKIITTQELSPELKQGLDLLKKRRGVIKAVERRKIRIVPTKEGMELAKAGIEETLGQLTPEMLLNHSWKGKRFRPYDVGVYVKPKSPAKRHPLQRLISEIRNIFTDMGFKEISGDMVQSSFWNFDALFQPQDHPARDMHDTFYLKNPKSINIPDFDKYKKAVGRVHENGGDTGSVGWGYKWSEEVARKTVLRTHTTALTCRYLSQIKRDDLPVKVFSIGKVFRNEAVDYKHLPEFYQVEGIVVDPDANFRNLLGILKEFYDHMGCKVRFRPGYFPYTEMSVEPEVYFEEKDAWVELGGSGIFRPEVVKPLLGFDCPVLAWGLGLDRVVMLNRGLKDIRDLYISDLDTLRSGKVV